MMLQKLNSLAPLMRKNWVIALLMAICIVPWLTTRISSLYQYQTPPNQTIHPNYYTFHEMSQSWDEGQKLGVIDVTRMVTNMHRIMLNGYSREKSPDDKYCTYLSLDPGYAVIVSLARKIFITLPDSYLRAGLMQVIFDGAMLFAIFITFLRIGPIPATIAGILYGIHPVFSYQAIFPFQYFWEGWLFAASVIALIWARRFSLGGRSRATLALVVLIALMTGFSLWVRSTALIASLAIILTFLVVPSLRRYFGIFILIFTLTVLPQAVRASSVQGHFALSTRMSWHTAYHALGRYPNKYGIEDEDLYVFNTTQDDYGVSYNYCDYSRHDAAAKQAYMKVWEEDPAFVIRSVVTRIATNILYNYNFEMESYNGMILFLLSVSALIFALLRRGEYLFVTGLMAFVYLGYNVAVGLFYYIAPPYAYITQLALLFCVPVFVAAVFAGSGKLLAQKGDIETPGRAPLAKIILGMVLLSLIGAGVAMSLPDVRSYVFQKKPNQYLWMSYNEPNREDNEKMVNEWKTLPADLQKQYLDIARKYVPATDDPATDVTRYIAQNYLTLVYFDRSGPIEKQTPVFTMGPQKIDLLQVSKAVSISIPGWNMREMKVIDIRDPDSWKGDKVHITLQPEPDLAESDYQTLATKKFNRFNYDVTWVGPYELIARHNGHGCDALRAALAVYYNGNCPYDPQTGQSPLTPEMDPAGALKSLTSAPKTGF